MSEKIKVGDIVTVCWADSELNGIVINTPNDVGDMWQVKDVDGKIYAINPSASTLEAIIKAGDSDE